MKGASATMKRASVTIGSKLRALVRGNCISASAARSLTPAQRAAIERLNMSQVHALIEVRDKVGRITTAEFI